MQVTIRVLGPIEVSAGQRHIRLAGQKQRALALDFGKVVSVAQLVGVLWGSSPPASARAKIQGHVSAVRQAVGRRAAMDRGPAVPRPPSVAPRQLVSSPAVPLHGVAQLQCTSVTLVNFYFDLPPH